MQRTDNVLSISIQCTIYNVCFVFLEDGRDLYIYYECKELRKFIKLAAVFVSVVLAEFSAMSVMS